MFEVDGCLARQHVHEGASVSEENSGERGAMLPLLAMSLAMLLISVALLAGITDRATRRARAQSAADASSLAGVAEGRDAARRLAGVNGAVLVEFTAGGNEVTVVVEFAGVRAVATAERHLGVDP